MPIVNRYLLMKRVTTYFFAAAVVLLAALPTRAQVSLSGTIRDADGPLPGVAITLDQTDKGASTDETGAFRISKLRPGSYQIHVSLLGYESVDHRIDLRKGQALRFTLHRTALIMDEVVVSATRVNDKSAIAYTTIGRTQLDKLNLGQDLPQLLNFTPSLVSTSDAGAGVGYTGFRIRGSDATRINLTLNGIPYNDAESQGTYFVDMPDVASSVSTIQIQRGVGTSTNGAGAFGASINIQTNTLRPKPYGEVSASGGSFGTYKTTISAGTGLLAGHFVVDARLSRIHSNGYIDRAFSELKSFSVSGGYYSGKNFVRLNVFSGRERTYQAWAGVPDSLLAVRRTFNPYTYSNQTDNYQQDQYQVITSWELSRVWRLNVSGFYTKGSGYYEEFRADDPLSAYGVPPVVAGKDTITTANIVRQRWLDNDFYGTVFSLDYDNHSRLTANIGGGWNQYRGAHFGEIVSATGVNLSNVNQQYYLDNAVKTDANLYAKAFYQLTRRLNGYVDLQVRAVDYSFLGFNSQLQNVQQSARLPFFNPKAGLTFSLTDHSSAYASVGVGHKEPNRDDYTQSTPQSRPLPERLIDYEVGYRLQTNRASLSVNGYFMNYTNQLVLSGRINDVGAYNRINVARSYRLGVELEANVRLSKTLRWNANLTLSRNKVGSFTEYIDNYDTGEQQTVTHEQTDLSFSPNVVGGSQLVFSVAKGLEIGLLTKYVGPQFLDNTSSDSRKLSGYGTNDMRASYTISHKMPKSITFTLLLNNVLNAQYISNGYTYAYVQNSQLVTANNYFPQAGRHFLAGVTVKF